MQRYHVASGPFMLNKDVFGNLVSRELLPPTPFVHGKSLDLFAFFNVHRALKRLSCYKNPINFRSMVKLFLLCIHFLQCGF